MPSWVHGGRTSVSASRRLRDACVLGFRKGRPRLGDCCVGSGYLVLASRGPVRKSYPSGASDVSKQELLAKLRHSGNHVGSHACAWCVKALSGADAIHTQRFAKAFPEQKSWIAALQR
jgi:hypothetical protein